MAARATMTGLIMLVRGLINDPQSATAQFTDEAIQEQLDNDREYVLLTELTPYAEPDGTTQLKFQSQYKYWETDVALTNSAGTVLTPTTSDLKSGYFTFTTSQDAVYATGFVYDVYAASAVLLTLWAGRIEQDVTKFSADGSSYEFEGLRNSKLKLAAQYKAKSTRYGAIQTVRMVRDDYNTD
ncbi:MAG: hypothetical protein WC340_19360 [Kiritimatiellia bacterium]